MLTERFARACVDATHGDAMRSVGRAQFEIDVNTVPADCSVSPPPPETSVDPSSHENRINNITSVQCFRRHVKFSYDDDDDDESRAYNDDVCTHVHDSSVRVNFVRLANAEDRRARRRRIV